MNRILVSAFLIFGLHTQIKAQIFQFGYHQSRMQYQLKGLQYDFYRFNEQGSGHSNLLNTKAPKGIFISFGLPLTEYVYYNVTLRTRRFSTEGQREIAPIAFNTYEAYLVRNSGISTGISFGPAYAQIGYEIELTRFRIRHKEAPEEEWGKLGRNEPVVVALGLHAAFRVPFSDVAGLYIKPYWRPSFGFTKIYGTTADRDRLFRLSQIGIELGLCFGELDY